MENKEININESFNEEFCGFLSYHLGETFQNSGNPEVKGFWCDGVMSDPIPRSQLNKKNVNDTRRIETKAWIGKDGQGEFDLTIKFGKQSLGRYAKGLTLEDCVPSTENMDWVEIDIKNKKIEIQLN